MRKLQMTRSELEFVLKSKIFVEINIGIQIIKNWHHTIIKKKTKKSYVNQSAFDYKK